VKLLLYVEGDTEAYLPAFIKRWLDPQLPDPIRIKAVKLGGAPNYLKEVARRVRVALSEDPKDLAVGLIDLYGSPLSLPDGTIDQKYAWAKQELERRVGHARFRQHFAVHETEAWLFSDPAIFPAAVIDHLPKQEPEKINFLDPPSRRLSALYRSRLRRAYGKTVDGGDLFNKLDPHVAYSRCPHLRLVLDGTLKLVQGSSSD